VCPGGALCVLIGRPLVPRLVPTFRWRCDRPKFIPFRSRSKRVRFVHSSPLPLQKRLRLRKSELDKKTMLFFETTCILRCGSFQSHSGVEEASVHKSTPAPKMDSTVRPLLRAGGNNSRAAFDLVTLE
jgi:hypothetical protein